MLLRAFILIMAMITMISGNIVHASCEKSYLTEMSILQNDIDESNGEIASGVILGIPAGYAVGLSFEYVAGASAGPIGAGLSAALATSATANSLEIQEELNEYKNAYQLVRDSQAGAGATLQKTLVTLSESGISMEATELAEMINNSNEDNSLCENGPLKYSEILAILAD